MLQHLEMPLGGITVPVGHFASIVLAERARASFSQAATQHANVQWTLDDIIKTATNISKSIVEELDDGEAVAGDMSSLLQIANSSDTITSAVLASAGDASSNANEKSCKAEAAATDKVESTAPTLDKEESSSDTKFPAVSDSRDFESAPAKEELLRSSLPAPFDSRDCESKQHPTPRPHGDDGMETMNDDASTSSCASVHFEIGPEIIDENRSVVLVHVSSITNHDILFLTGGGNRDDHPGNKQLHRWVMEAVLSNLDDLDSLATEKLVDTVLQMVHSRNGRFLAKDKNGQMWKELSTQQRRACVTKALLVCHDMQKQSQVSTPKTLSLSAAKPSDRGTKLPLENARTNNATELVLDAVPTPSKQSALKRTTATSASTPDGSEITDENHVKGLLQVAVISDNDVLFFNNERAHEHCGNKQFSKWINHAVTFELDDNNPLQKERVVEDILQKVASLSGRFLTKIEDRWVELPLHTRRLRVSQALTIFKEKEKRKAAAGMYLPASPTREKSKRPLARTHSHNTALASVAPKPQALEYSTPLIRPSYHQPVHDAKPAAVVNPQPTIIGMRNDVLLSARHYNHSGLRKLRNMATSIVLESGTDGAEDKISVHMKAEYMRVLKMDQNAWAQVSRQERRQLIAQVVGEVQQKEERQALTSAVQKTSTKKPAAPQAKKKKKTSQKTHPRPAGFIPPLRITEHDVMIDAPHSSRHPGTCAFRRLLETHRDEYKKSRHKLARVRIADSILRSVPGRILCHDTELSAVESRKAIMSALEAM